MTRRLVVTYLIVTALALALLAVPLGVTFARREKERLLFNIERDADAMGAVVEGPIQTHKPIPRAALRRYAARTGGHVIVVDGHGVALFDTGRPTTPGRDYSSRPEIQAALAGRRVEGSRISESLGTTLLYAAVPVTADGRVTGAVRITYPSATLDARVLHMWGQLALLCLGVLVIVALVGFALARTIVRPVRRLEDATDRLAEGDLSARVDAANGPPELRHLATTFNRMADRLARLVDSQQRFVADAAHQLRTPLTALRLRLDNLRASALEANGSERGIGTGELGAVDAAMREVTRMSRLIDGLLLLARELSDHIETVAVDVTEVVRDRAELWADVIADRGVQLVLDVPDTAWAMATTGSVEQLVDNLVENAIAVSPSGATITVRVASTPTNVALHVVDQGPGLEASERARAFDRFWRATTAPPGGSGLGLAIVRQLAEASGGTARLDARREGGIDAVVELRTAVPVRGLGTTLSLR